MSPVARAVTALVVQVGCLVLSVYLVAWESALPGAPIAVRVGIGVLSLVVAVTYGEVTKQRAHLQAILAAIQSSVSSGVPRDDRQAVDTLVVALGSSDEHKREIAHRHLVRLTGKDFPPDAAQWAAWWRDARDRFPPTGA